MSTTKKNTGDTQVRRRLACAPRYALRIPIILVPNSYQTRTKFVSSSSLVEDDTRLIRGWYEDGTRMIPLINTLSTPYQDLIILFHGRGW